MNTLAVPLEIGAVLGLVLAWAVVGLAISFRLLRFPDIGIEGSLLVGATVFGVALRGHASPVVAVLLAMLSGAVVGAGTAFLHARLRINKFLAGIIVVAICYSLSLHVLGAPNVSLLGVLSLSAVSEPQGIDWTRLWPLATLPVVLLPLLIVFFRTKPGLRLRTAGANVTLASSLGISPLYQTVFGLALANALSALSGSLLAHQQGFVDVGMGAGILLSSLAGVAIGEALLPQRLSHVTHVLLSALLGSILYQIVQALAVHAGLPAADLKLVTALMVVVLIVPRTLREGSDTEGVLT